MGRIMCLEEQLLDFDRNNEGHLRSFTAYQKRKPGQSVKPEGIDLIMEEMDQLLHSYGMLHFH